MNIGIYVSLCIHTHMTAHIHAKYQMFSLAVLCVVF